MNIQWYPGHMTKSRRMMTENLKLVDVVIELLDARIPTSSKNPDIDKLAQNKKRIIALNKIDLADPAQTELWAAYYKEKGFAVVKLNSLSGMGMKEITAAATELMRETMERDRARGRIYRPIRAMIAGIPNVGKSAFINRYVGRAAAKTGDKPGVTRGGQWIRIKKGFELLDTPGILWPKFDDEKTGLHLAFTGAVNDNILDTVQLASLLLSELFEIDEKIVSERYDVLPEEGDTDNSLLERIAISRGFLLKGSEPDLRRAAAIVLDEFRAGKLGRITLDRAEKAEE